MSEWTHFTQDDVDRLQIFLAGNIGDKIVTIGLMSHPMNHLYGPALTSWVRINDGSMIRGIADDLIMRLSRSAELPFIHTSLKVGLFTYNLSAKGHNDPNFGMCRTARTYYNGDKAIDGFR